MPGEEFRVALQEAHACGAQICFGDRPVQVCPTDFSFMCINSMVVGATRDDSHDFRGR